jgi:hypothetical protein
MNIPDLGVPEFVNAIDRVQMGLNGGLGPITPDFVYDRKTVSERLVRLRDGIDQYLK